MPEGVNIPNEKRWIKSYISHPSFLKKLIANTDLSEEEAKAKVKNYLKNIDSTSVEDLPWEGGNVKGQTSVNSETGERAISFFQDTQRGTPVHEFTHASDLDKMLNKFKDLDGFSRKVKRENVAAKARSAKQMKVDLDEYELWNEKTSKPFLHRSAKLSDLWSDNKNPKNIDPGEMGFNPNYNKNLVDYINDTEEVYPRIMKIRFQNNLKPGEVISPEKMKSIKKTSGDDPLFEIYDDEQVMEFLNKLAKNKPSISNETLAVLKNKGNGKASI